MPDSEVSAAGALNIDLGVEALSPQLTGIGRYTLELLRGLREHRAITCLRTLYEGCPVEDAESLLAGQAVLPSRHVRRWRRLKGRVEARLTPHRRLYHGPNFMLPRNVEEGIVTVHDLSVLKFPQAHPAERIAHFERDFAHSLSRALHIITDTEEGRREVLDYTGLAPDRVTAVHLGVSRAYNPARATDGSFDYSAYGLEAGSYILLVATFEPRKRIETALLAYRALPDAVKARFPLALAGASGWKNEQLHDMMSSEEAKGQVRFLGFVPEAELPGLYAGAALFLFPSVYEGFGLPPVEAMASGVPCIVSNRSCLPEVTQGAAMLIDPDDIDGWCGAIEQGLNNEYWRGTAIADGLRVASGYGWEETVRKTISVYARVQAAR